jgi:hypothetical protein
MPASITRTQVLAIRIQAQQLDRAKGGLADTSILDFGVQDTGVDGATWALANRGVSDAAAADLVRVWTIRGAPHLYRRADLPRVAAAVEPFSDADAGKRIYDASKPLKAAGIGNLEALDAVAAAMRALVTRPMVKGDVSGRLAELLDAPYLRFCRPCDATHIYEMPFRLAALRAGLELEDNTSPPVLRRIPGFKRATATTPAFDVIRGYLRLLGPATPKLVAGFLDAPVTDVKARWPRDAVEVSVEGETRWLLADDMDRATSRVGAGPQQLTRLLGPYDLFMQAKDRELMVPDAARVKALWPVIGRPGAVLHGGDIVGMWRPRSTGGKLTVRVELWAKAPAKVRTAITEQAQRLADLRQAQLSAVDFTG